MKKEKTQNKKSEVKKPVPKWFYLVLILLPVFFLLLLEVGLRIFDYGKSYKVFTKISSAYPDMLFLNPGITRKYFTTNAAPSAIPDGFKEIKPDSTFRVFVLGESSAAGWPYVPNASFPRQLKRRLELLYPDINIEVVNLGISAICTYTIKDFMPAVLEQKPDLILIYTGHNEYYGAMGVGSTESAGSSRWLTNVSIYLEKLKTYQLVRDFIKWAVKTGEAVKPSEAESQNETLMARMIRESLIPLNSKQYYQGIEQFKDNMTDILEMARKAGVPVILSTLASNLCGHYPFISVSNNLLPSAESVYKKAEAELKEGNKEEAKKLFYYAKDLDALRFRAPSAINSEIFALGKKFGYPVVDADSAMNAASAAGITGTNLMVDHLHPNIEGYKIIADRFYFQMEKMPGLIKWNKKYFSVKQQDSILALEFPFTQLDSMLANLKLWTLIGGYPFVPKGSPNKYLDNLKLNSISDSVAVSVMSRQMPWETGHVTIAERYYSQKNYIGFLREMKTVIAERPFNYDTYKYTIKQLADAGQFDLALPLLLELDKKKPDDFTAKGIGQIYLVRQDYKNCVKYLEKFLAITDSDPQVLYNISGAYFYTQQYDKAMEAIKKCIRIAPNNRMAIEFYNQLSNALGKK